MTSEQNLVAVILFHVLGETSVTNSRARVDTRVRGPEESIRDYAFALLELAELAYPGPNSSYVQHACERFADTVSKSPHVLYRHTVGNPNLSMETLASMATIAERSEEMFERSGDSDRIAAATPFAGNTAGSSRPAGPGKFPAEVNFFSFSMIFRGEQLFSIKIVPRKNTWRTKNTNFCTFTLSLSLQSLRMFN